MITKGRFGGGVDRSGIPAETTRPRQGSPRRGAGQRCENDDKDDLQQQASGDVDRDDGDRCRDRDQRGQPTDHTAVAQEPPRARQSGREPNDSDRQHTNAPGTSCQEDQDRRKRQHEGQPCQPSLAGARWRGAVLLSHHPSLSSQSKAQPGGSRAGAAAPAVHWAPVSPRKASTAAPIVG